MMRLIFSYLMGALLGYAVCIHTTSRLVVEEAIIQQCDPTEETRLKIAMEQCSDLAIQYTWNGWCDKPHQHKIK